MLVQEGMSEVVLTLGPGHTLREAAEQMADKGVGAALVATTRRRSPASSPSATSCLPRQGEEPDAEKVADHMSDCVIAAAPDWSLERAAAEMSRLGIRHLVVYDGAELVGVLSMRDIVRVWTTAGATSGRAAGVPLARARRGFDLFHGEDSPADALLAAQAEEVADPAADHRRGGRRAAIRPPMIE